MAKVDLLIWADFTVYKITLRWTQIYMVKIQRLATWDMAKSVLRDTNTDAVYILWRLNFRIREISRDTKTGYPVWVTCAFLRSLQANVIIVP